MKKLIPVKRITLLAELLNHPFHTYLERTEYGNKGNRFCATKSYNKEFSIGFHLETSCVRSARNPLTIFVVTALPV